MTVATCSAAPAVSLKASGLASPWPGLLARDGRSATKSDGGRGAMASDRGRNASALVGGLDLVALKMNGTLVDSDEGIPDLVCVGGDATSLGATGPSTDGDGGLA
jgi:hypothetical protein